jgi:hypothetical protein
MVKLLFFDKNIKGKQENHLPFIFVKYYITVLTISMVCEVSVPTYNLA